MNQFAEKPGKSLSDVLTQAAESYLDLTVRMEICKAFIKSFTGKRRGRRRRRQFT